MFGIRKFIFICTLSAVTITECRDMSECVKKKSIFKDDRYSFEMNPQDIRYMKDNEGNLIIRNTMTYRAQVSQKFMNNLCLKHYCLGKINMDWSSLGYTQKVPYGWFRIYTDKLSFGGSNTRCLEDGAILGVPDSIRMKTYLLNFMETNKVKTIWIGAHDAFNEQHVITLTDETYPIKKLFYDNEQNNVDNNCLAMNIDGSVKFHNCFSSKLDFLCQFKH